MSGPAAIRGVPHVAGVRTSSGEELRADLVVDAMGRRSPGAELLTALGARPHTHADSSGFAYYTQYFTGPSQPPIYGPVMMPLGTISTLTLYGDNNTWSVTIHAASKDAPLKALRDSDCFARVVGACPLQAHWLDGQPVTGVLPMGGFTDLFHRFVANGVPVATTGSPRSATPGPAPTRREGAGSASGSSPTPSCCGGPCGAISVTRRASRGRGMRGPNGTWPRSTTTRSAPIASAWRK